MGGKGVEGNKESLIIGRRRSKCKSEPRRRVEPSLRHIRGGSHLVVTSIKRPGGIASNGRQIPVLESSGRRWNRSNIDPL